MIDKNNKHRLHIKEIYNIIKKSQTKCIKDE